VVKPTLHVNLVSRKERRSASRRVEKKADQNPPRRKERRRIEGNLRIWLRHLVRELQKRRAGTIAESGRRSDRGALAIREGWIVPRTRSHQREKGGGARSGSLDIARRVSQAGSRERAAQRKGRLPPWGFD